jgi:hypothetical protein
VLSGRVLSIVVFAGAVLCGTAPILSQPAPTPSSECYVLPKCRGCGCRGGPGYRFFDAQSSKGRCVGYRELDKLCGVPPETRCVYEGMPNTGLNRDCVAEKVGKTAKAKAGAVRKQGRGVPVETGAATDE